MLKEIISKTLKLSTILCTTYGIIERDVHFNSALEMEGGQVERKCCFLLHNGAVQHLCGMDQAYTVSGFPNRKLISARIFLD